MTCFSMRRPMTSRKPSISTGLDPGGTFPERTGEDIVLVIGAGRFGTRAVRILTQKPHTSVWVVDREECSGEDLSGLPIRMTRQDGVDFLVNNLPLLAPETMVVPAVPIHLAAEWLRRGFSPARDVRIIAVPDHLKACLPHTWITEEGSFLVSYADFLCPEDCPEPEDGCTVTGEIRPPLYEVLAALEAPGFDVHVIQSRQLAPGLGGYSVKNLLDLRDRVLGSGSDKCLIGTACRCHGTLTGLDFSVQ